MIVIEIIEWIIIGMLATELVDVATDIIKTIKEKRKKSKSL